MTTKKYMRELDEMLKQLGLSETATIETKGKHWHIIVLGPLGSRKIAVSCTPSDHRSFLNLKSYLRHAAVDVGISGANK